MPCSFVRRGTC